MHLHIHLQCRPDLTRPDLNQIHSFGSQIDSWTNLCPALTTDRRRASSQKAQLRNGLQTTTTQPRVDDLRAALRGDADE